MRAMGNEVELYTPAELVAMLAQQYLHSSICTAVERL